VNVRGDEDVYEPILDFDVGARRRLVEARRDEILLLLDRAFSDFVDAEPDVSLAAFGFRGDDPVAEVVAWAVERFASASLDPAQLHPRSRSFRLFTEVRFWLAQKVGRQAYDHIINAGRRSETSRAAPADDEVAGATTAALEFGAALAGEMPAFRDRTCADLVGFWLVGTKRLRRDWFGWREAGDVSEEAASLSKKQRSLYAHDAMFRFLCCLHRLVPAASDARAEFVYELAALSGCPNAPPYRVADRAILPRIAGVAGPRVIARLRKEGAHRLVDACLVRAARVGAASARDHLMAMFTRSSLGPTTLHALDLDGDEALRARVGEICSSAPAGAS
jgi:hypothetical protein